MKAPSAGVQANDLEASAAIDLERADTLRREADALTRRATDKRAKAAALRNQAGCGNSAPPVGR